MRVQLFRRPIRCAVAAVAAAAACTLTLAVAPAVSAQSPTGPQPAIAPQTQPGQICILIYPPPPGCPTNQPPPSSQPPDVCIQIYPPPPGCPGSRPSQPPPPPSLPRSYPGGAPGVQPAPVQPVSTQPVFPRGQPTSVTLRSGGVVPNLGGFHCQEAWFEVLGPGGWAHAPGLGAACSLVTLAPQVTAAPVVQMPAGQQPGTYRLVLRVTSPIGGVQVIHCDPFVLG